MPQPALKSKWRLAFRIDLRRATLAISGITGVLALVFFLATREPPGQKRVEGGFGDDLRTGSILVMPLVGDTCQQSVFDNDTGEIRPIDSISCEEAIRLSNKKANVRTTNHVTAVSETFRK